jgi:branched-chain amino acid transport system ATP-binding protein
LLELHDLTAGYGGVPILRGLALRVEAGEIAAIVGSNGAGKTTAIRAISGVLPPMGGRIVFQGRDVARLEPHDRVALGIVEVPEGRKIFGSLTVLENLELGSYNRRARPRRRESLARVLALFPRLGERLRQRGATLSGGEQQMLAIGRGLMALPELLILDEPSLGLAPIVVRDIFRIVREVNAAGLTVLLVEQNVQQTLSLAHRAFVLENGAVTLQGTGAELLENPHLKAAYLGL